MAINNSKNTIIEISLTICMIIYRQLYYILNGILFFQRKTKAKSQKYKNKIHIGMKTVCPKVDLNEEDGCLKSTDESINFSLKSSIIVVTDIIDNTRLYNEFPLKMKYYVILHYKMVVLLLRKHSGHLVANEGDSFHLAFQNLENATDFAIEFLSMHLQENPFFQVRVGINKGKLCVRKFCGYKVFGKVIEETQDFSKHNQGRCICIKKRLIEKQSLLQEDFFCIH